MFIPLSSLELEFKPDFSATLRPKRKGPMSRVLSLMEFHKPHSWRRMHQVKTQSVTVPQRPPLCPFSLTAPHPHKEVLFAPRTVLSNLHAYLSSAPQGACALLPESEQRVEGTQRCRACSWQTPNLMTLDWWSPRSLSCSPGMV